MADAPFSLAQSFTIGPMIQPLILCTNDDGIFSPGLWTVAGALRVLGDVVIVAPDKQYTSVGRAHPAGVTGVVNEVSREIDGATLTAYSVDASPGQCIHHAVLELLPRRPDLVVSGINYGDNVGTGLTASGTIGAAIDAAAIGLPALAVSMEVDESHFYSNSDHIDFAQAAAWTCFFAKRMLGRALPFDVDILKVEVPEDATPETPWRVTRQSRSAFYRPYRTSTDLQHPGRIRWRQHIDPAAGEDSDIRAVADKVVSVTPLSIDLTSRMTLDQLEGWLGR